MPKKAAIIFFAVIARRDKVPARGAWVSAKTIDYL